MSVPTPKDVIAGFFADMNAGHPEQAFARLSSDIVYHVVAPEPWGGVLDLAGLVRTATGVFERLAAPLQVRVETLVAEGDRVVAEVCGSAPTKRGGLYENKYLFLYRVADGMIVEAKEYLDSAMYVELVEGRL